MDPNVTYKQKFQELTKLLGRTPTTRDKGWLALQEEYKKSWGPADETVLAPRVKGSPYASDAQEHNTVPLRMLQDGDEQPDTRERAADGQAPGAAGVASEGGPLHRPWRQPLVPPGTYGALTNPPAAANPVPARSATLPVSAPSRFVEGSRGPTGGIMARCQRCGQAWERPKKRGRPAYMCEECR